MKKWWALAGVVVLAGLAFAHHAWQAHEFFRPESLFSRFPAEEATALSIDVAALRKAGLLAESKDPLEPEYKAFLEGTGFDYRHDLDSVAASFSRTGNYFIARGRFNFDKLRAYALSQGGSCFESLCRMQGTQPDRHISFLPLRGDALALAVATDDLAASRLAKTGTPVSTRLPGAPVWFSMPGSLLRQPGAVPPGLRLMLSALTNADRVLITAGPGASGIEAHLETSCPSADQASVLLSQLRSTTAVLKEEMPRNQEIRGDDLAKTLAAGVFEQAGARVTGRWPISKSLIDSLTAGI
jgi:hypothetical protein